ncbi:MAG: S-adenosylmethionine synthetase, partial [Nitrospirae bacterium]|nr:S-adenosylmethionine synthetase [Nitrospirota bacterium]
DQPKIISAQLILEKGASYKDISKRAEGLINLELDNIQGFCNDLADGRYPVC